MYKEALKILKEVPKELYLEKYLTGSYVITRKQVYKDIDFLLWTDSPDVLGGVLLKQGFVKCGEGEYEDRKAYAYRKGPCNIIIISEFKFFLRWKAATLLATQLKLIEKQDRIAVFAMIINQ